MSSTTTNPSTIMVSSTDRYYGGFTQASQLPPGGSVFTPTVTITDKQGTVTIALQETPTVTGTKIVVLLDGADLTVGHRYLLRCVFNGGSLAPSLTSTTTIEVPN